MEEFYDHFIHKYYIFHQFADLDLCNSIDDVCVINNAFITPKKKLNEQEMYKHTRHLLEKFLVFKSSDINFTERLDTTVAEKIYDNYRQYKEKQKVVQQPTFDPELDTSDTYYLSTPELLTTEHLVNTFGDLVITGTVEDKHRYEYKFRIGKYIFSVYDWLTPSGERENKNCITWHIAGNSDNIKALAMLTEYLKTCSCCIE